MGVQESNLADLSSAELDLGLDELTMLRWRFITPESVPAKSEKTLACTWGSELLTRERVFSIRHRRAVSAKFAETAQKLPVTGIWPLEVVSDAADGGIQPPWTLAEDLQRGSVPMAAYQPCTAHTMCVLSRLIASHSNFQTGLHSPR